MSLIMSYYLINEMLEESKMYDGRRFNIVYKKYLPLEFDESDQLIAYKFALREMRESVDL